jgi:hypothetical protein
MISRTVAAVRAPGVRGARTVPHASGTQSIDGPGPASADVPGPGASSVTTPATGAAAVAPAAHSEVMSS